MQCILRYKIAQMLLTFIQLTQQVHYSHITVPQILIKQVRIYHWKFSIIFLFIWLNKVEVFQFSIIYIQIRLFLCITQNATFNLLKSIFITLVVLIQFTLISPRHICSSGLFYLVTLWKQIKQSQLRSSISPSSFFKTIIFWFSIIFQY